MPARSSVATSKAPSMAQSNHSLPLGAAQSSCGHGGQPLSHAHAKYRPMPAASASSRPPPRLTSNDAATTGGSAPRRIWTGSKPSLLRLFRLERHRERDLVTEHVEA